MTISELESYLGSFENSLRDLEFQTQNKTSSRVLTSYVWMQDQLTAKLERQLKPMLRTLEVLKAEAKESGLENNLLMAIKYNKELIRIMEDLIVAYRQQLGLTDLQIMCRQSVGKMRENLTHLKNRSNIIRGMIKTKKENDEWIDL